MEKVTINTDGGSRGNPGIAGAGAVIADAQGNILKEVSLSLGVATNNDAEYRAVILGLESLKKLVGSGRTRELAVEIRLDSQLVANQLSGKYQIKEETLWPHFIKISNLRVADFPQVTFTYIPREENARADALANRAMDEASSQQGKIF